MVSYSAMCSIIVNPKVVASGAEYTHHEKRTVMLHCVCVVSLTVAKDAAALGLMLIGILSCCVV